MRHYALIPAKKESTRLPNKNWRQFINNLSLVDFTLKSVPKKLFSQIIVSTDNKSYQPKFPSKCTIHQRERKLAQPNSDVNDLIRLLIKVYNLKDEDYLWLLNPTSPFRTKADFQQIKETIETKKPKTIISVTKISPYIWKENKPLFTIGEKRKNTQALPSHSIENGMFYVFRVKDYKKNKGWYNNTVLGFEIRGIRGSIDIDTEEEFSQAQKIAQILW